MSTALVPVNKAPKKKGVNTIGLAPIPEEQQKLWDELIAVSRQFVAQKNNAQFNLIIIAGELETYYGDGKLARWAEEIGLSWVTARTYRSLYIRGVDRSFIEQWGHIGYAQIKEIANYCGKVFNPVAQYWLQYASEHVVDGRCMISADALRSRMTDFDTELALNPEQRLGAFKLAMAQKADFEKMNPELKMALEKFVEENYEENPTIADRVLETKFLSPDGQEELAKIQEMAGIRTPMYEREIREIKNMANKIKSMRRWWVEHYQVYEQIMTGKSLDIRYGSEIDVLKAEFDSLVRTLEKVTKVKPEGFTVDPSLVEEVKDFENRPNLTDAVIEDVTPVPMKLNTQESS